MADDPFLDPLQQFQQFIENDKAPELPPDTPDGVRKLLEELTRGVGERGGTEIRTAVVRIGPNGPEVVTDDNGPHTMPDEIAQALIEMMKRGVENKEAAPLFHAVQRMRDQTESDEPGKMLAHQGVPEREVAHVMTAINDMVLSAGTDVFGEEAFKRLYTETDLFERVIYIAQMFHALGAFMQSERGGGIGSRSDEEQPGHQESGEAGGTG